MQSKNFFLFIESNTSGTGELLIQKCFEKGFLPIFITDSIKKYSFLPMDGLTIIEANTLDNSTLFDIASSIKNLRGIYSSSEFFIEKSAHIAKLLHLPTTNSQTIATCRQKNIFYSTINDLGFLTIKTRYITRDSEAIYFLKEFSFPVVIKPSNASGSMGVKLCPNELEATNHIGMLFDNGYTGVLIQEYIEGDEFSIEVCTIKENQHIILGITKKYLGSSPFFIEMGHDFPANLPIHLENFIITAIENLLSAIKFDFGFCHIEFRLNQNGMYIIELNPRLAGGMIPILIQKARGVDILGLVLDLYSERKFLYEPQIEYYSSIRFLSVNRKGVIKNIKHPPRDDIEIKLLKNMGEFLIPKGDYRDRVAYIMCTDSNPYNCKKKANDAINMLEAIYSD